MKRVGLALGGGGAKGTAHLAFLKKLDDMKIVPSVISGTSIGSLIGALYCAGQKADELLDFLTKLDETPGAPHQVGIYSYPDSHCHGLSCHSDCH